MNSKLKSTAVIVAVFFLAMCSSAPAYAAPPTDPCSLLTQVQVSAVLDANVEPGKRVASAMCGWSAKQPTSSNIKKIVLLISNANAFGFAKTPVVSGESSAPASGICDDATYSFPTGKKSGATTDLFVKKGNTYFVVHVLGVPDQATAMKMEKTLALDACSKL